MILIYQKESIVSRYFVYNILYSKWCDGCSCCIFYTIWF